MSGPSPFPVVLDEMALLGLGSTSDTPGETASLATLCAALQRIEDLVQAESEALRERLPIDFGEVSRRKSRCLLELSRIARAVPPRLDAPTVERVRALRDRLQENLDLLGLHLSAAEEVSGMMQKAMQEAASDGTYSTLYALGRGRP